MYGRLRRRPQRDGQQPPAGRHDDRDTRGEQLPDPPPERGRRGPQVRRGEAGQRRGRPAASWSGTPKPRNTPGEQQPARGRLLDGVRRRPRGRDHQQHEQRVRVVEPEHQHGDRRQREHGAGEQPGRRPGDPADRRLEQRHRGDGHQRLRGEHAPRREAEDPPRQRHHPQRGGRLVDGDRVGGVERAEEERRPALRAGLDGGGVEASWPSRRRRGSTGRAPPVPTSSTASAGEFPPRPEGVGRGGNGCGRVGCAQGGGHAGFSGVMGPTRRARCAGGTPRRGRGRSAARWRAALASDEHGQLDGPARVGRDVPEQRQRTRSSGPARARRRAGPGAGGGRRRRGRGRRRSAGGWPRCWRRAVRAARPGSPRSRPARRGSSSVQQQVRERARHADRREPDELARHRGRHPRHRSAPAGRGRAGRAARRPAARPIASARPTPGDALRSATAVATMSTRESGSSTQSTGTSWMRRPARSASTSSSVSKNQPVSSTSGSSRCATSARIALKPHCASENPVCSVPRSSRL